MSEDSKKMITGDGEIDILAILSICWKARRSIIIVTACFFVFGVLAALLSSKEYSSSAVFVPQSNQSLSSSYSYLASAIGIDLDLNMSDGPITPRVYPHILENVDFQKDLMYTPVRFSSEDTLVCPYNYFTDKSYRKFNLTGVLLKYSVGLPGLIAGKLRGKGKDVATAVPDSLADANQVTILTKKEQGVANILSSRIKMDVNATDGYLVLTAMMPDPLASAELCQAALDNLRKYLSVFKAKKASQNLLYIEEQYMTAKADYEKKLAQYASFVDANRATLTATASIRRSHLQSEAELARSLYSELARNLSTARVKKTEDNVVLVDVRPVSVPDKKTKPKTLAVVFIWTFLGLCISCARVIVPQWWKERRSE